MDDQRTDVPPPNGDEAHPDDVEGHALALPLVLGLDQAGRNRSGSRPRQAPEEAPPPLTKPFPRLRDPKRT
jgi:hypothetical protein